MAGRVLVGTASWTDRTLLESGWYPNDATTAETRLSYYAERFPLVEVDATYYGLPSERNAVLWAERTPKEFTFDVKAFSLMTGHPTKVAALPKALRESAPEGARTVRPRDLPDAVVSEVWEQFRSALMPLHSAGKLGTILMQYPEWVLPGSRNRDEIAAAAGRLPDYRIAVEFRRRDWLEGEETERTLIFLRENGLVLVCLDMPQGFASSMPDVTEATADDIAILRLHGRNSTTWKKRGITAAERFNYLYEADELAVLSERAKRLSRQARTTHVVFNNCYRDKGVINAAQMARLFDDVS